MFALALSLGLLATVSLAQSTAPADGGIDPPDRVARLSYMAGDVGFLPAGASAWNDASINRPLTLGDKLSTAAGARAELELGGGSLRIDGRTDFGFLQLDNTLAQVELTEGTLNLSVRALDAGQSYEIDTPTVALVVDRPGIFRIDVAQDGRTTQVTAFDGNATVYGENHAQRDVLAGRSYTFADAALAHVALQNIGGGDAFDQWCAARDRRYVQSVSGQYVSADVVGYQDLDSAGSWQSDDDYGEVWYPAYVASDWAPYRYGHWASIAPWGWTWVDDAAWGFAPYHYGRWASVRGRWGWIPGPRGVRPIYAPALVAFVGGGRWSSSVGIGARGPVGWFPLGPGEVYNPWYRASHRYYQQVNERNMRDRHGDRDMAGRIDDHYRYYRDGRGMPDQHYANRDLPHGFTAVPGDALLHAQKVQQHLLRVDGSQLPMAPVLARGNALQPLHAGAASSRGGSARELPIGGFRHAVVAGHAPDGGIPVDNRRGRPPRDETGRMQDHDTIGLPSARYPQAPAGIEHAAATNPRQPAHDRPHGDAGNRHAPSSGQLLPLLPRFESASQPRQHSNPYPPQVHNGAPSTLPVLPRIESMPHGDSSYGRRSEQASAPHFVHAPRDDANRPEPSRSPPPWQRQEAAPRPQASPYRPAASPYRPAESPYRPPARQAAAHEEDGKSRPSHAQEKH
jgi:hypothetical protein